jgi:acetolactate synthase I/II/III large subunit
MPIEPMLTGEEPVAELVGRVLQEAGIEYVFGISGGHTGRIVGAACANTRTRCTW